jgi:hypothetical protein
MTTAHRHWSDERTSADAPSDVAWPGTWAAGWNAAVAECTRQMNAALRSETGTVLADVPGKVGNAHPETSRRAAATLRWGTQRYQVLAALTDAPQTSAELSLILNRSRNQTATRVLECREAGFVVAQTDDGGCPVTRPTGPSDEGQVWCITPAGRVARWKALDARSQEG